MILVQNEFHKKGNFLSDAIQVNLNGPISSLDAVINNEVGKDGKTEWERLLGEPVDFTLELETTGKIYKEFKRGLSKYTSDLMRSSPDNPVEIPIDDIMISAFEKHAPNFVQALEKSLESSATEAELKSELAGQLVQIIQPNVMFNGAALRVGDLVIVIPPPEATPEFRASQMMGISLHELPPHDQMGTSKDWQATDTLHELEHLTDQRYNEFEHAPNNILEIGRNIQEIDSVYSSIELVKPFASSGFTDYYMDARTIGTHYKLVMSLDSSSTHGIKDAMMHHAVSNPIENLDNIRAGTYSLDDYTDDQKSLARKIREELGVHDDSFVIPANRLSLKEVTDAVISMVEEAESSSLCWKCLNDEELQLAKDFLKSVDDAGFTEMWNAPEAQVRPAVYKADPDNPLIPVSGKPIAF